MAQLEKSLRRLRVFGHGLAHTCPPTSISRHVQLSTIFHQGPLRLYCMHNLLFTLRPVMGMTSTIALKVPVRVAIETSPEVIDTYSSDQLIEKIVERARTSNVTIRHLLTRIDRNAFITFDYGVPDDDNGPQVFRLRLRMTESGLSCDKLSSGRRYVAYVNSIVEGKTRTNIK
ncbi:MAG: hypothetical protein M1839_004107 [Geoglossum umbratile]|nr:MAG: hypothetical protein M1839_004107 [Geoglossum umbratile]